MEGRSEDLTGGTLRTRTRAEEGDWQPRCRGQAETKRLTPEGIAHKPAVAEGQGSSERERNINQQSPAIDKKRRQK